MKKFELVIIGFIGFIILIGIILFMKYSKRECFVIKRIPAEEEQSLYRKRITQEESKIIQKPIPIENKRGPLSAEEMKKYSQIAAERVKKALEMIKKRKEQKINQEEDIQLYRELKEKSSLEKQYKPEIVKITSESLLEERNYTSPAEFSRLAAEVYEHKDLKKRYEDYLFNKKFQKQFHPREESINYQEVPYLDLSIIYGK